MAETTKQTQFSQPIRQIVWMLAVLVAVGLGCWFAYPSVAPIFTANPWLNGTIAGVFVLGVIACFAQVFQLFSSVAWLERFARDGDRPDLAQPPGLLSPLAPMVGSRTSRSQLSTSSSRSILDSVAQRMDEARDITRFIVNTLIFLGLLGTFWGLATTVPAVVDTIRNLDPGGDEGGIAVFSRLIGGLEDQLAGMGTAFASSLLGLAGSLVVGLLELFAGHGQNRFYRELEDWLSSITRIGLVGDGETIDQYSLAAVLDHMNYQMEQLQDMFQRAEAGRATADERLAKLTDSVTRLAHEGGASDELTSALLRLGEGQAEMTDAIRSGQQMRAGPLDGDEGVARLRSIDTQMVELADAIRTDRTGHMDDLRTDISALTRSIRQLTRLAAASAEQQQDA